jgi:hypothetical protein
MVVITRGEAMSQISTNYDSASAFATTLLQIAADIERDEAELKSRIERAAQAGDTERVVRLMVAWKSSPASEVLKRDAESSP